MADPARTAASPDAPAASVSTGDADATLPSSVPGVLLSQADTDLVLDLAAEYEDARANSRPVDVAVLCRARPDLIPKVEALIDLGGMLDAAAVQAAKALPPAAPDDEPMPDTLGRYRVLGLIGRGGMGVVYRATDTAFGREVAIKVLQEKYGPESGAARRFADEARITGQLQHPAIPPVHDLGTLPDGRPFLAMKLIKGDTLDDLLNARSAAITEYGRFVPVFEAICQGVAYAHARRVIHHDLKPANVMVGSFGEVQVMDWGLAKVLTGSRAETTASPDEPTGGTAIQSLRESDGSFTHAGSVLGTPAFMPPEQAIGAVNLIDARSDVFGLGGILCAIQTGMPPFVGDSSESNRQLAAQGKVADAFARLDASATAPELVALCKRCLAPEQSDRPADAGAVATAVAGLRAAADERARQAELDRVKAEGEVFAAAVQEHEQRKRRCVWVGAVAALTVVAFGGFGAFVTADKMANAELESEKASAALRELERESSYLAAALARANELEGEKRQTQAAVAQAERNRVRGTCEPSGTTRPARSSRRSWSLWNPWHAKKRGSRCCSCKLHWPNRTLHFASPCVVSAWPRVSSG